MEQKKSAYQIKAKVKDKSWMSRGTTLTASSEQEAISKAKEILRLTDEHEIQLSPVVVYSSSSRLSTDNYPYGRLKATAFFQVESNKKGFRSVFQTINPKTERLNNPKKGNYCAVMLPIENENGHIDFCGHNDMNGGEEINRACHFINDFYELFTEQEIERMALHLIMMLKVHISAVCTYCGVKFDDMKPFVDEQVKAAVLIAKNKENLFLNCILDNEKIESLKTPDYKPFTVKRLI
jgi:hypothetical protein